MQRSFSQAVAAFCCLAFSLCILSGCKEESVPPVSSDIRQSEDGTYSYSDIPTVSDDTSHFSFVSSQPDTPKEPNSDPSVSSPPISDGTSAFPGSDSSSDEQFRLDTLYPTDRPFTPVSQERKWFYRNLTQHQKQLYEIIDRAVITMQSGKIALGACSYPDLALVYTAVKSDHPEYFWLPTGYIYELVNGQMYIAFDYEKDQYKIHYPYTREERDALIPQLRQILEQAAAILKPDMSEYDRALALHDWLCARLTYDEKTAAGATDHPEAFTIASLLDGAAVCEGYARSYQLLLYYAGLENALVNGRVESTGHMWNMVKIDGNWYHTDATWNDSGDQGLHTYFNLTDAAIVSDHTIDPDYDTLSYDDLADSRSFNFRLPACRAISANFFALNGTLISGDNAFSRVVTEALIQAAREGRRSCEFGFGDTYPIQFTSSHELLQKLADQQCVQKANEQLPAGKQLPSSISCNGIIGSKGFALSW